MFHCTWAQLSDIEVFAEQMSANQREIGENIFCEQNNFAASSSVHGKDCIAALVQLRYCLLAGL